MKKSLAILMFGSMMLAGQAGAQTQEQGPQVLRDLESMNPHPLTIDETKAFMVGARVSRLGRSGNTVYWTNEDNGSLFATSDNLSYGHQRSTTTRGKWNITDDGRYCVLIEYARTDPEQWCRFIIKTDTGYYGANSMSVGTSKVYKLDITK